MSKATLWDVFDAAMGTAELVTGEIAKYKIEQDEAELRKFELEQKKKMADFDLQLQNRTDFDNFESDYNRFMDQQQKNLMSRIKTNYGQQRATEWFDNLRVDGQIQIDKLETDLRKNNVLQTNMDIIK
jgi:multidrug resistance efflux pump